MIKVSKHNKGGAKDRSRDKSSRDVPREGFGIVTHLAKRPRDQETVPERVHVGAPALPEDGVAVPAALARREMERLVHVAEEVDQEAKRDPTAGSSEVG